MTERTDPFANLREMPSFERKPRKVRPADAEAIELIAEESGFVSRQPRKQPATPRRKPRVYRTGRSLNFSLKATIETRDRFHKEADARGVTLARLLELALEALEKQGQSASS